MYPVWAARLITLLFFRRISKMGKKLLALLLVAMMIFSMAACAKTETAADGEVDIAKVIEESLKKPIDTKKVKEAVDNGTFKIGVILVGDENEGYTFAHIEGVEAAKKALGLSDDQIIYKYNIPETEVCYDTAIDLVEQGCDLIFANSFSHESFMWQAAEEHPEVVFAHATGTTAATNLNLPNVINYFTSIYESRYVSGIVAGLKLKELMDEGKVSDPYIGYVGAYPYAEVVSGYTAFFLGIQSIVPEAHMDVTYTNSWFDIAKEKTGAETLINNGCILISQHADSEGAPKACEEKGVPNVAYNVSTINLGPNTALISSKINWAPYYEMIIKAVAKGESFATDWCGTVDTGSVELTELNEKVAAKGTKEVIEQAMADLKSGKLNVFDTKAFTFKGEHLKEYLADVVDKGDFQPETNVIVNGVFVESGEQFRSAPYFDMFIDGIKKYE